MSSNSELAVSNSGNRIDSNSLPIISFHSSLKVRLGIFLRLLVKKWPFTSIAGDNDEQKWFELCKIRGKVFSLPFFLKFGDVFIWSFLVSTIYLWDDLQKSIRFPFIKCQHVVIPTCKPYSGLRVFTCVHHSIQGYTKGHKALALGSCLFFWLTCLSGADFTVFLTLKNT